MKENPAQLRRVDNLEHKEQELDENALRLSLRKYIEDVFLGKAQFFPDNYDPDGTRKPAEPHATIKFLDAYLGDQLEKDESQRRYDTIPSIFLEELLAFIKTKKKIGNATEKRRLTSFVKQIKFEIFSQSNIISSNIEIDDLLNMGAQATRIPEVQGWFGSDMVNKLIVMLYHDDFDGEKFIEKLRDKSLSEVIDLIDFLRTTAIQANDAGQWALPSQEKIISLINKLKEEYQMAFVNYASSLAIDDIANELPSADQEYSGKYRWGNKNAGRTARGSAKESTDAIASDAVAKFDHAKTARSYKYADSTRFVDYDDMANDQRVNPFGKQDADLPLLLQHLHNPEMRRRIEDDLKISLRELPLRAQIRLLEFLAEPHSDRFGRLQKILQKHPEAGNHILLSFLSCAEDKLYGEAILTLAETLPSEISKQVFEKYAEIVGTTEDIAGYIREQFGKDVDEADVLKITQNVLHRGNELLKNSAESATAGDDIMNRLEKIQSDTVLFASSFKTLFKSKEKIDFLEVRGLDFQRQPISWLSDQDKSEMLAIAKANWSSRGNAGEGVIGEFGDTLKHGKDIDFYILRRDGKIISFVRFDAPTPEGHRYAGSFNVDQQYRGSAIGEAMIYNALDKQAEQYTLDATVYPKLDVGTKYVEQTGFAITNVLHNYDNSGEDFFEITCDRRKNKNFVSREAKKETLMALVSTEREQNWRELVGQNLVVLKFDAEREHEQVLQATKGLISAGYIGTRYFADPADKKKRYYVFEMDKTEELHNISNIAR